MSDHRLPARRDVLRGGLAVVGGAALGSGALHPSAAQASGRHVRYYGWTDAQLWGGILQGVSPIDTGLTMTSAAGQRTYPDPGGATRTYDYAVWMSPKVTTPILFTQAITSWNAWTPDGTWVELRIQVWNAAGTSSGWMSMGRWARHDPAMGGAIHRRSVGAASSIAHVAVDTLACSVPGGLTAFALQVLMQRPHGSGMPGPSLHLAAASVSNLPPGSVPVSPPGVARGIVLGVPTLSQEVHLGHYPQWDGGGEAWCSATSTAMVLQYWGTGPTASDISWVTPSYDGHVDYAARGVYDYAYEGCGNWSFNVAYASMWGCDAFVTRLRSLAEAELFIQAGIPLVVSMSFTSAQLPGAGYSTTGHLMVICGFTAGGDVVVNDPASHLVPDDRQVRTTYPRAAFENAWVPASGGTAYVIFRRGHPLPTPPAEANWPAP